MKSCALWTATILTIMLFPYLPPPQSTHSYHQLLPQQDILCAAPTYQFISKLMSQTGDTKLWFRLCDLSNWCCACLSFNWMSSFPWLCSQQHHASILFCVYSGALSSSCLRYVYFDRELLVFDYYSVDSHYQKFVTHLIPGYHVTLCVRFLSSVDQHIPCLCWVSLVLQIADTFQYIKRWGPSQQPDWLVSMLKFETRNY